MDVGSGSGCCLGFGLVFGIGVGCWLWVWVRPSLVCDGGLVVERVGVGLMRVVALRCRVRGWLVEGLVLEVNGETDFLMC